ncbi:MAG TPA: class D sortase [Candidatus Acidoferrales bacterium]|nr:class D sortase [Candidatus Acidoferrales bacterium]
MTWLRAPITKQDQLALLARMYATEKKLKSKIDSFIPWVLWLGLRIAARSIAMKTFVADLWRQLSEGTRPLVRRTLGPAAFALASWVFAAAAAGLAAAAFLRSRLTAPSIPRPGSQFEPARRSFSRKTVFRPALRVMEAALWVFAAATLGYCSYAYASAAIHQRQQKAAFTVLASHHTKALTDASGPSVTPPPAPPTHGEILGILDIPRIGLSSIVEQGSDSHTLRDSVGHIPGTALPGQNGNAALAAHRDTYFRHLSELRPGDDIIFHSVSATYMYKVKSTSVVQPTDTAVLASTKEPTLTLVTCFPFYYVGNAPKRFVLVATEDVRTGSAKNSASQ